MAQSGQDQGTATEIVLTRAELYEQVWITPVDVLAGRYGISGRGLGKLCARQGIPVPPRGYWAKLASGKKPKREPLASLSQPDAVFRFQLTGDLGDSKEEPEEIAREWRPENHVDVDSEGGFSNPMVVKTNKLLDHLKPDDRGICGPAPEGLNVRVSEASRQRALRIIQALIDALVQRGYLVKVNPERDERYREHRILKSKTVVTIVGHEIEFGLEERAVRTAKNQGINARLKRPIYGDFDFLPSGNLCLFIGERDYPRFQIKDAIRSRLENRVNEFIIGLIRAGHVAVQAAEEARLREMVRLDREFEERREERFRKRDQRRFAVARNQIRALDEAMRLRALGREIIERAGPVDRRSEIAIWTRWLTDCADKIDPVSRISKGERVLSVLTASQDGNASTDLRQHGHREPRGWPYPPWYRR